MGNAEYSCMLKNKYAVAIIASMAILMAILDNTIVNVALTNMSRRFDVPLNTIQWVITSFFLAQAMVIPIAGYLGNRFGMKKNFLFFLGVFTLGSLMCALSKNETELIAFRILQGLGGGALFPLGQAIAVEVFPVKERAKASIIIGMSVLLGPIFGPTLGGYLVDRFDWPSIFTINIPIGVITAILAVIAFPPDRTEYGKRKSRFDVPGLVLSMIASLLIVYGFAFVTETRPGTITPFNPRGEIYGWGEWRVWALLGAGVLVAVLFTWYELRQKDPVLDLHIFRNPYFRSPVIILWLVAMTVFASMFLIPIFYQQYRTLHFDAMQTGLTLMPQGIAAAIATIIGGRLYYKLGVRNIVLLGVVLLGASSYLLSRFTVDYTSWDIMPALLIRGLGFGFTFIPSQTLALQSFMGPELPKASSLLNVTRQIFSSIGISVIATIYSGHISAHLQAEKATMLSTQGAQAAGNPHSFFAQAVPAAGTAAMNDVFLILMYASIALLLIACILPGKTKTAKFLHDERTDVRVHK